MKNQIALKKIVLALAVAGVSAGAVHAATLSTASARANVLQPLTITQTAQMDFGNVAGDDNGAGSVTLATDGTITASTAYAAATGAAGSFDVAGDGNMSYTIDLNGGVAITLIGPGGPGVDEMTVTALNHDAGATPTLSGGAGTFKVGGTLNIGAGQTAGAYSGTYTVTVNY